MKYGSASEYAKVRRQADKVANKATQKLDDERPRDGERVKAALADYHKRIAELNLLEAAAEEEARARSTAQTLKVNKRLALGEYNTAGILPPWRDEEGFPTVSLSLALLMGWTIGPAEYGTRPVLHPPPKPEDSKKRETRIDEMGS